MRISTAACALVLGTLVAVSGGAHATGIIALEAGATVNGVDPAVDGTHGLAVLVWEDEAGNPQVTILLDGEPIENHVEDLAETPAPDAPALPPVPVLP